MTSMGSFAKGTCMEMCPRSERELREREGLIHPLEASAADFARVREAQQQRSLSARFQRSTGSSAVHSNRSKPLSGVSQQSTIYSQTSSGRLTGNKPRYAADPALLVKSYQRSAAGLEMGTPENLRPAPVLVRTVQYLLSKVVHSRRVPWCEVHGFISDRLRSVRQDATIQQIDPASYVAVLEACARFYALSTYRQCNEHTSSCIDQYLNRKQLEETLNLCVTLYDEYHDSVTPCRLELECIQIVLNIDNYSVLQRALKLKEYSCIASTLKLSLNYSLHMYTQVFKGLPYIPALGAAVFAAFHLASFRKRCLGIINAGFSCRNNFLPLCYLQKSLLLSTEDQVKYLCAYYGMRVENRGAACVKAEFQGSKATEEIFNTLDFLDADLLLADELCALKLNDSLG